MLSIANKVDLLFFHCYVLYVIQTCIFLTFSTLEPELWRSRGFSTLILMKGVQKASLSRNLSSGDQGTSLPWSWWKVSKRLLNLETWVVATKGLLYLYLNGRYPRGISTWAVASKGLLYLDLDGKYPRGFSTLEPELWRSMGFSTLILMKGVQGASLPRYLSCGDQGASLPQSWWKVSKGLLYLGTWVVAIKGLLFLDLDERCPRGFSTSKPEILPAKD